MKHGVGQIHSFSSPPDAVLADFWDHVAEARNAACNAMSAAESCEVHLMGPAGEMPSKMAQLAMSEARRSMTILSDLMEANGGVR